VGGPDPRQVAGLTIDHGVIARIVATQASPDRPVGLDRAGTGALSACDQIRRSTGRWSGHDWTARSAPPTSRGAKNRFDTSFVWMDAMQDFTASLASRAWEGPLGDPTSTTTEERFLCLAGSELDRAYRLAGFLLGDAHEAEDATQDALIRAWRSIRSLRDPDGFRPWFDRILVNLCRDRLRRRRRIRFIPLDGTDALTNARDPFGEILDRDEALGLLDLLEPDERIVVVLHYWADLTLVEVARRLDRPIGTVKSRLHRALDTMAMSFGGRGGRR
jgi:RNA polymerase sigma-70 factor (ECF subfamily)